MHLTARMAWHDRGWDGHVCNDPKANTYCTGSHSLLSGRIEKNKDVDSECSKCGQFVGAAFQPQDVPPCFWSINAFGDQEIPIEHKHPFSKVKRPIAPIPDVLKPNSFFTWPFKLSFVHDREAQETFGSYPPDLEQRIDRFARKFAPNQSVVFFYANYDNPVTADDLQYLVVGCSLVSAPPVKTRFKFAAGELQKWKSGDKMQNFPEINWALQFSHDKSKLVRLPYHDYVAHVEKHPDHQWMLDEIKVVPEESSLVRGFKYVAMDIDDDKCLYLLYKLRRAIKKAELHRGAVVAFDFAEHERRLTEILKVVWEKRGTYPGLRSVLEALLGASERIDRIASAVVGLTSPTRDLKAIFQEVAKRDFAPELDEFEDDLYELSQVGVFKRRLEALARLSLVNLSVAQAKRVIANGNLLVQLPENLYALCEDYEADPVEDLDSEEPADEPIELYKIDLAVIPDKRFMRRHRGLQKEVEDSPTRIRAVYIQELERLGERGHCFAKNEFLVEALKDSPILFALDGVKIDTEALIDLDAEYKGHFIEKLHIRTNADGNFIYLRRIYDAEVRVRAAIESLLLRQPLKHKPFDVTVYVETALKSERLRKTLTSEELRDNFRVERQRLFRAIFSSSLFLLTGKPGAGKTYEISKVIEHLRSMGEQVEVLAPTGKAALRLTDNLKANTDLRGVQAKTIDKLLFEKFPQVMAGSVAPEDIPAGQKLVVENIVLDESSMVDLEKLDLLLALLRVDEVYPRRLIFVGDENQLPPIGFGKPFFDVIQHVVRDESDEGKHYINLQSNCRQENDPTVLTLADAFTDRARYYEEALELLNNSGWVSKGLHVTRWRGASDLSEHIEMCMHEMFRLDGIDERDGPVVALNREFGLRDNGYVNNADYQFHKTLKLEAFQILTPYRAGYYGALGLNKQIQGAFRDKPRHSRESSNFYHADKLIRLFNWYWGQGATRRLALSNGSIGICVDGAKGRQYYFKEQERPLWSCGDEDDYDLAYAISVHRSQGSDFTNVFLVVPRKLSLLSRELVYTALTRSRVRLFLFVQEAEEDLMQRARITSHLIGRNTSLFGEPSDTSVPLIPLPGAKPVRSRVEYIIHRSLQASGLDFAYEEPLQLSGVPVPIHPDFRVRLPDGRTVYWEHLGMLDVRKYYKDWQRRLGQYREHGLLDDLVTTDDLGGINEAKIGAVIDSIRNGEFRKQPASKFSSHHFELYGTT